ncbi:MAG: hypothetical protein WC861_06445 [Candidatus Micrarchaeia archaeon]|jgi:hypothetical protein
MIVCTKKAIAQLGTDANIQKLPAGFEGLLASGRAAGLSHKEKMKICDLIAERVAANLAKYPLMIGAMVKSDTGYRKTIAPPKQNSSVTDNISIYVFNETVGSDKGDRIGSHCFVHRIKPYRMDELPILLAAIETNIRDKYWTNLVDDVMCLLWKNANMKGIPRYHTVQVGSRGTGTHGYPDVEICIRGDPRSITVTTTKDYKSSHETKSFQISEIMAAISYAFGKVQEMDTYIRTGQDKIDEKKREQYAMMLMVDLMTPED